MISEKDQVFLELLSFTIKSVATNDQYAATTLIDRINEITLDPSNIQTLRDGIEIDVEENVVFDDNPDAYTILVTGLNCITGKEYLLNRHGLSRAIDTADMNKLREYVDESLSKATLVDSNEDDFRFISLLIRACTMLRDFKAMDMIRGKMVR